MVGSSGPGIGQKYHITFEECKAKFYGTGKDFVYHFDGHNKFTHCQEQEIMFHTEKGFTTDLNKDWQTCTQSKYGYLK